MSRVFPESFDELPLYLCHLGALFPSDIVCPPYLFWSLPVCHLLRSMGGNFSLKVRSWASGSQEPGVLFLCLAGSSRGDAGREFRLFCRDSLAVLAALLLSMSQVPVMTFFSGTLSVFLAYLYTWYWLLDFFRLKIEKQRYHWKRLFKAWLHVIERYLQYRYFTYDLLRLTSSPSSWWTQLLPAVESVWVLGAWVSNGMFGGVSLHGPISCLALGGPF